jgi:predicted nucleic acid-binding Zn ribbon protein
MAILRKLERFVGREETMTYQCGECGATHEAVAHEREEAECADCGASGATAVPQM